MEEEQDFDFDQAYVDEEYEAYDNVPELDPMNVYKKAKEDAIFFSD